MMLSTEALARLLDLPSPTKPFPPATGVAFHSARVRPGDAFFALAGATTHGIEFADDALAAGAAWIVSDHPHPRSVLVPDAAEALLALGRHARAQWRGPVVGVTGSAGKTTTKELLAGALGARSSEGNFNTPLALARTLIDGWLAEDVDRPLVLELGIDRPGEMAELAALVVPDAAILTLVGHAHLHGLGTVARVAEEKSILLAAADRRFASAQAHGWIPSALRDATTTYALAPAAADIVGTVRAYGLGGQTVSIGGTDVELPHLSRAAAENAVGAFAVAVALGIAPDDAAAGLARANQPPGRLQIRAWGHATILDDTYNSNPASAADALDALRRCPGPHVVVLGDMLELGEDSASLHRELGAATRGFDRVLAFGPESRHVAEGNPRAEAFTEFAALKRALSTLDRSGTVLVKGSRGMALERAVDQLLAEVPA